MSTKVTLSLAIKGLVHRTFGRYLNLPYSLLYDESGHDRGKFFLRLSRVLRPTRREYRRLRKMSLRQWLIYEHNEIESSRCHWMGVPAIKNPLDAWVYQEIIYKVRPDVIVEIGSRAGGSTLFLAQLLHLLGNGIVISVDVDRKPFRAEHERIVPITGDSSAPEVVAKVSAFCQGKVTLVLQDGDHSREGVLKDLRAYSKLVSVNSYFIVEDGIIDLFRPGDGIGDYDEGPLPAIHEFLAQNPDFVIDYEQERYILTSNPTGFLRRVR